MSETSIEQMLQSGLARHQAGQLAEAESIYRCILDAAPDYANAWHLLGIAAHQSGRHELAVQSLSKTLALQPQNPEAHHNMGEIWRALGQGENARLCYQQALTLRPDYPEAHHHLGLLLHQAGYPTEALPHLEAAVAARPGDGEAHGSLGDALAAHGQWERAHAHFTRAAKLLPNHAPAHAGLGNACLQLSRNGAARTSFERALALQPDDAVTLHRFGLVLAAGGDMARARTCFRRALALRPEYAQAQLGLGNTLRDGGHIDESLACYREAVRLLPGSAEAHSLLVHTLHLHRATDGGVLRAEHRRWNAAHAAPLRAGLLPPANDPDPARRLRVGYVSPDFWFHSVSYFTARLFESHDRDQFEVHCYASVLRPDPITDRMRQTVGSGWHDALELSDEALAAQVRADGIDILVDLSLHTHVNRLPVFARKPAPVQVSWLGYAGSSGLDTMDYRLTDALIEPPDRPDESGALTDAPVRLPDCWCCYDPLLEAPPVRGLPALDPARGAGAVTFGSLNFFGKIGAAGVRFWGRVLAAVPGSRLLLHGQDEEALQASRAALAEHGITGDRIKFTPWLGKAEYWSMYDWMDIALDPFPHNGMTITCEALWMGVPVITLSGTIPVSRTGLSLLSCVGLPELAARDEEEFVRLAAGLGNDLPRLAALRASLRGRMRASPLTDAPRFTRNVEAAYRQMWQRWCARQPQTR